LVRAVSWRLLRSMKMVPERATSQPITGQRRTSDLATKRTGLTAWITQMSSQDTWFATSTVG
jgi:hypothetical protein